MFGLWRCAVWRGHDGWNTLKDEVTPTPPRLQTWPALVMTILIFEKLNRFEMHPSEYGRATLQTR